jgi:hypothetical protein
MMGGYIQLRRGLFEHVTEGRITSTEAFLYMAIIAHAKPDTGIWTGSSGLLASLYGFSPRTARDLLEKLESKGYIKRFPKPGSHSNYPVLINKYECSDGAAKGWRLNATATIDCEDPVYEPCEESVHHSAKRDGKRGAGIKEENREEKNERTAPEESAQTFVPPDWIPREPWDAWLEIRKGKRAKNTPYALSLAVTKLDGLRKLGQQPADVLNHCVLQGWQGIFPIDRQAGGTGVARKQKTYTQAELHRMVQKGRPAKETTIPEGRSRND